MLTESQVKEQVYNKTGLHVRNITLEKFAECGLIDKPIVTPEGLFYFNDTPKKFIKAATKIFKSSQFQSRLVARRFERDGDKIIMYSTYDHSDLYRENYELRMSGDKGYIDKEKDIMRVGRIAPQFYASLDNELKLELEEDSNKLLKYLKKWDQRFITTSAKF